MEKFFQALFDINKIPTKLIIVIWVSSALMLFTPAAFLTALNLNDFLQDYGKYVGITFLLSSGFTLIAIWTFSTRRIKGRKYTKQVQANIIRDLKQLNFHEKALLREFSINRKYTLQLPFDNDTVVGLLNKHIIYQASSTGFQYYHGSYFPYTITEFVLKNLTNQMIDMPENPNEQQKRKLLNDRPDWAKEKQRIENILNW